MVEEGQRVCLLGVNAGHGLRERLAGLGLIPGVEVEVLNNNYKTPVIVAFDGNRIMLGRGMARKIAVERSVGASCSCVSGPELNDSNREYLGFTAHKEKVKKGVVMSLSLGNLQVNEKGKVVGYAGESGAYREKLLAMGLTKGAEFEVVRVAPLGDPVEITLMGFNLSLRKGEAEALLVERS
jgi:ferrous iron transport protein A